MIPRYLGALFLGGGGNIFGIDVCLGSSLPLASLLPSWALWALRRVGQQPRAILFLPQGSSTTDRNSRETLWKLVLGPVSPTRGDPSVEPLRHSVQRFTTQAHNVLLDTNAFVPKGDRTGGANLDMARPNWETLLR